MSLVKTPRLCLKFLKSFLSGVRIRNKRKRELRASATSQQRLNLFYFTVGSGSLACPRHEPRSNSQAQSWPPPASLPQPLPSRTPEQLCSPCVLLLSSPVLSITNQKTCPGDLVLPRQPMTMQNFFFFFFGFWLPWNIWSSRGQGSDLSHSCNAATAAMLDPLTHI